MIIVTSSSGRGVKLKTMTEDVILVESLELKHATRHEKWKKKRKMRVSTYVVHGILMHFLNRPFFHIVALLLARCCSQKACVRTSLPLQI